MPKVASPHFDPVALLIEVHKQDFGLVVSTNSPPGFLRLTYAAMRANPALRTHIYRSKRSQQRFTLLKAPAPAGGEVAQEPTDGED